MTKFDNSPCGEISTSPTQRCVLQTGSHTPHDIMFRWSKFLKEARTLTGPIIYFYTYKKDLKKIGLLMLTMCLGINIGSFFHFNLVFSHKRKLRNNTNRFSPKKPKNQLATIYTQDRAEVLVYLKLWSTKLKFYNSEKL